MQTALELPKTIYDQARRAAMRKGITVEQFITGVLEEKLRSETPGVGDKHRINLPLVPSAHPGSRSLTAERAAEILSDDDVSH